MEDFQDIHTEGERQAIEAATQIHEELSSLNPHIEIDAKEFGEHVRNGGWRLGLLVARSVQKDAGRGGKDTQSAIFAEKSAKVSTRSFARQAGNISDKTVGKYLTAWDLAAADGHVLSTDDLQPGQAFTFEDDTHTPELWKQYFKPPKGEEKLTDFGASLERSISGLENMDLDKICEEMFNGQLEYSPEEVYEFANRGIRRLLEIQNRIEGVATKLGYTVTRSED